MIDDYFDDYEDSQTRLYGKGRKTEKGKKGPYFNLSLVESLHKDSPYEEAKASLKTLGFIPLVTNIAHHHKPYREPEEKDEFILWYHPAGILMDSNTITGGFTDKDREQFDPTLKRFNAIRVYWQHLPGGGEKSRSVIDRICATGNKSCSMGDGTVLTSMHETISQRGDDLKELLRQLNASARLVPIEKWSDEFFYIEPGLYLDCAEEAHSHQEEKMSVSQKDAQKEACLKMIQSIDNVHVQECLKRQNKLGLGHDKETKRHPGFSKRLNWEELRTIDNHNDILFNVLTCANIQYPSKSASQKLKQWSLGTVPTSDIESWNAAEGLNYNALHAGPCIMMAQKEAFLEALKDLKTEDLLRLANEEDARGVTPFMNALILARSFEKESDNAMILLEELAQRVGPQLNLESSLSKMGALNLLIQNPIPRKTRISNYRDLIEPFSKIFEICMSHQVPILNSFHPSETWEEEEHFTREAKRREPKNRIESREAFIKETKTIVGSAQQQELLALMEQCVLKEEVQRLSLTETSAVAIKPKRAL